MSEIFQLEVDQEYLYQSYKARNTIWYFNEIIKNGYPGYASIKFKNKDEIFCWLENIRIEDGYYCGVLEENNKAQKVPMHEAVDWMIIEKGRMLGGYSIRHYLNMLGEYERKSFDLDCKFQIDEGNDFFKPDRSTPEGAIITIEQFYNKKDLNGVFSCKDFRKEAENIMIAHSVEISEKTQAMIMSALKMSLIEDLESNGFPHFEGIERVFTIKDLKEDQQLIEEKVIYKDGSITINNLWVWNSGKEGWKVLNLEE